MTEAKPIPKPPREKVQGAAQLREATLAYCRDEYFPKRWWSISDSDDLDYRRYVNAWQRAQPLERPAQQQANKLKQELRKAEELLQDYPEIEVGGPATVWLRELVMRMHELERVSPEADYPGGEPCLREWFRWESLVDIYEPSSVRDWTVLAVVGGYWRESIPGRKSVAWALQELDKSVAQQIKPTAAEETDAERLREALKAMKLRKLLRL